MRSEARGTPMRRRSPVILVTALLILLVPAALAQGSAFPGAETRTQVTLEAPSQPAAPGTTVVLPGNVTYTWQAQSASTAPTTLSIRVTAQPSWVQATVHPATVQVNPSSTNASGAHEATRAFVVNVTILAGAPAGAAANLTITANASANGPLLAASRGTASVPVETTSANASTNATGTGAGASGAVQGSGSAANHVPGPGFKAVAGGLAAAALAWRRRQAR